MDESSTSFTPPTRMVTRGTTRQQQYLQAPGPSTDLTVPPVGDPNFSLSQPSVTEEHEEQQSDFPLDSSSESVFRTPLASTRGRKRRAVVDDGASVSESIVPSAAKRGRPRGTGRVRGGLGRRAGAAVPQEAADESSLFSMVKNGKNLNNVINVWIEEYEKHWENALVRLQQFFISCCGCKGIVSSVMLQTMEYSEIIRRMTEQFDEESGDYPLIMPGPQWKKFKQNFAQFTQLLVDKCKASYVFDQRLMDSVIQLLTGLADSQVRAFRHTSTFAAMKLSSALVDVALELVSLKEKNSKQIETEKAKLKARGANEQRLDQLITRKTELDEKTEDVRQMLQYIFKSVFVHRYRDVLPDIRSICISELGQWMQVYPDHFLEDSYLKYIGWSLYDKVSDVRHKCVLALLPLYERPEVLSKLELFTNKFKDRLVSMVMDKDNEVAMRACQLLTAIYRVFSDVLELKDCVPIYELVYCSHRGLAQAAGEFLNTKVFQHSQRSRSGGSTGSRPNENAQLIRDLIQFFMEGDCHDHAAYLVDALIDTNPMMKDWKTMADMLLSGEADRFDGELIEVLVCAVKQAATGEGPVGRGHTVKRGALSAKEQRVLSEDRARLSEVLIPQLPALLHRFIADRDKVANLITIARHFQLDMYLAGRLEKHLDDLMNVMESIVEKHADDEVLQSVAQVMTYFTTNVAVAQHTDTHRLKMLDGLALQLRHSVMRFHREQTLDEEDDAAMLASFRKITAFAIFEDLKKWQLWEPTLSVLNNTEDKQPSRDVCEKAVLLLFHTLAWELNRFTAEEDPNNKAENTKKLKKHRDQFVHAVETVLTVGASGVENAFLCLVDTLMLFNGLEDKSLEVQLERYLINAMTLFVIDNVFVDESDLDRTMDQQSQIELMHKRRNLLTQYCKLILYGILEVQEAFQVLRFYNKYYTDFGDILKTLVSKCREMDKLACAKAIISALCCYYDDFRKYSPNNFVDPNSDDFASVRELAKRFSTVFGSDQVKSREALAVIHKNGILFALMSEGKGVRPENLTFLEVLIEFSGRLMRQDKLSISRYLEKHGVDVVTEEPYLLYKGSLQERNDDVTSVRSFTVRGRGRGRGRGKGTPTTSVYGGDD